MKSEDRITTGELFPLAEDISAIQDYMYDIQALHEKIDIDKLVDIKFAKEAEAK